MNKKLIIIIVILLLTNLITLGFVFGKKKNQEIEEDLILQVVSKEENNEFVIPNPRWEDPAAWGILLVDIAQHLGNMYEMGDGRPKAEIMTRIKEAFDGEWTNPTDQAEGEFETTQE